jgi:AraC-like DNA-binding protein
MSPQALQSTFFNQLADPAALRAIFEHLPEVYFFVKDRDSRLIAASCTILARLGMRHEHEFVGKLDTDVFPPQVAAAYRADDLRVFRTGRPLINRLEVWYDEGRNLEWCLTTKMPLRDRSGRIIGLMGITRRDAGRLQPMVEGVAGRAAMFLRHNTHRVLSVHELARAVGVSERTLNRKINEAFGVSPYEFMLRTRIQAAAEALLQGAESIASIALAHGFCDQSTFTQHFRKRMGMTPRQFRSQRVLPR